MSVAAKVIEATGTKEPIRLATTEGKSAAEAPRRGAAKGAPDPAALAQMEAENLNLLGQVAWLMSLSPQHKHLFLADLDWRVRPAILLRQCRLFKKQNRPFAFVTWAYVTDEIVGRLQAEPGRLRPGDWRSGKRVAVVDVIAPFGGAEECVREAMKAATAAVKEPQKQGAASN